MIRILGNTKYPNSPGSPAAVVGIVETLRALSGHRFWADNLSLVASEHVDPAMILALDQLTDTYLLALARAHGGQLATFDRKLSVAAVPNGKAALHQIGGR